VYFNQAVGNRVEYPYSPITQPVSKYLTLEYSLLACLGLDFVIYFENSDKLKVVYRNYKSIELAIGRYLGES